MWELTMTAIEDDGQPDSGCEWGDENPVQSVACDLSFRFIVDWADGVIESTFTITIWIPDLSP
jgi:hypothetical protein